MVATINHGLINGFVMMCQRKGQIHWNQIIENFDFDIQGVQENVFLYDMCEGVTYQLTPWML